MVSYQHSLSGHEFSKIQEILEARKAWYTAVQEVAQSLTGLCDCLTTDREVRKENALIQRTSCTATKYFKYKLKSHTFMTDINKNSQVRNLEH